MKNLIKFAFLSLIIFSCTTSDTSQSETPEFIGKWKLVAILHDPGDGSGTYQPVVVQKKTINFLTTGYVNSNFSLCDISSSTTVNYLAPYFTDNHYITTQECTSGNFDIPYTLEDGYLILHYPCIEVCAYKFAKIN